MKLNSGGISPKSRTALAKEVLSINAKYVHQCDEITKFYVHESASNQV